MDEQNHGAVCFVVAFLAFGGAQLQRLAVDGLGRLDLNSEFARLTEVAALLGVDDTADCCCAFAHDHLPVDRAGPLLR